MWLIHKRLVNKFENLYAVYVCGLSRNVMMSDSNLSMGLKYLVMVINSNK